MAKKKDKRQASRTRLKKLIADIDAEFRNDILLAESDRGAVLVAAAFVEESLEHLLRAYLSAKSPSRKDGEIFYGQLNEFLDPVERSPLGSFAAKIQACYLLGVVDNDYRLALDGLRDLRNSYAHRSRKGVRPQLSFEAVSEIAKHILNPGVIDVNYIGLLPKEVGFDALVERVGLERISFSLASWIILRKSREATAWWEKHGKDHWKKHRKPSVHLNPIGRLSAPTYRTE